MLHPILDKLLAAEHDDGCADMVAQAIVAALADLRPRFLARPTGAGARPAFRW